jgi:hypothetical protein
VTRVELARAEIARRRAQAEAVPASPWERTSEDVIRAGDGVIVVDYSTHPEDADDLDYFLTLDPAHVLRVLAAADAALDRHVPEIHDDALPGDCGCCCEPFPCRDAQAVLDLYAPQETTR